MDEIEKTLDLALQRGAEFVDVRIFKGEETRIHIENGTAKMGGAIIYDIGLRVFIEGCWGVCSGNDPALILAMVRNAIKMAKTRNDNSFPLIDYPFSQEKIKIHAKIRPDQVDVNEKLQYISFLENKMKIEPIRRTSVFYRDTTGTRAIYNSEGASIEEEIMLTGLAMTATAQEGDRLESFTTRKYITGGYEHLKTTEDLPLLTVRQASDLLTAREISQGRCTAIFDPLLSGTLLHEVLGHCVEADLILQGNSVLKGKLGSMIAPEDVSVWDDPTVPLSPACYHYDDEGVAVKKKSIISNGRLTAYLHSLNTASQVKGACLGNARCQDYSCFPLVRMSNTYVIGSQVAELNEGLILKGTLGGEVEPGSGRFLIRPVIGELTKSGEVKERFKDIIVVGDIVETLQSIESVGSDFYIDSGTCEKEGQTVLIGSGGASLRISNVTIIGG